MMAIYSTPPHLRYPELRYIRSYAILNWVQKKFELSYFGWEEKEKEVQYGNRVIIDVKLLRYMYISIQADCT